MSTQQDMTPLSDDELMAEAGTALPDKEVASILDLNADLDLLSYGSDAQALSDQGVIINQGIAADTTAESTQDSTIEQEAGSTDGTMCPRMPWPQTAS